MSAQERVQVVIHGRTYQLAGADPEHTRRLARKVDETITRFSDAMPGAESYQLAILAALHLADELSTVRGEFEEYRLRAGASAGRILGAVESTMAEDGPAPDADPATEGPATEERIQKEKAPESG